MSRQQGDSVVVRLDRHMTGLVRHAQNEGEGLGFTLSRVFHELNNQFAELERALLKYGRHTNECPGISHPDSCTCGWSELKESLKDA